MPTRAEGEPHPPPIARMSIAVLALIGLFVSAYLALYKLGFLGSVQCGVGDCGVVQASRYAVFFGLPVALWGVGAYAALLALSLLGVQPDRVGDGRIALAIFAVSALGLLFSGYLTYLEAAVIRAWCQWCVISAVLITLIFLLSVPGLRHLRQPPPRRISP